MLEALLEESPKLCSDKLVLEKPSFGSFFLGDTECQDKWTEKALEAD